MHACPSHQSCLGHRDGSGVNEPPPSPYRFYCPNLVESTTGEQLSGALIQLADDQFHHAQRVLRIRIGEAVELFNGDGLVAAGTWEKTGQVRLESVSEVLRPKTQIDVAVAFPKGGRADQMLIALSQLGVDQLIPLKTLHSTVHPGPARLRRYEKLAIESAKQCRRAYLLQIRSLKTLEQVLREGHDLRLLACPDEPIASAPDVADGQSVLILIGPEGGWHQDEVALGRNNDCRLWHLSPHVLRVETAAVAAAAIARYLTC